MKKLLLLSLPFVLAGAIALTNNNIEANYADFDGPVTIADGIEIPPYHVDPDLPISGRIGDIIRPRLRFYGYDDIPEEGESAVEGSYNQFRDIATARSYLGWGYNVINSRYINGDDVLMYDSIIDRSKLSKLILSLDRVAGEEYLLIDKETRYRYDEYKSSSMEDIAQSYGASMSINGNYGTFFSGGLKADFRGSTEEKTYYYFYRAEANIKKFRLHLTASEGDLRSILSDEFKEDLEYLPASELFYKYGTHLIRGVTMGGRLEVSETYSSSTATSSMDVQAAVDAHVSYIGSNINAEMSGEYHNQLSQQHITEIPMIRSLGAEAYKMRTMEDVSDHFGDWVDALNNDLSASALVDVPNYRSLVPLWSLVEPSNQAKRQELENYFITAVGDSLDDLCNQFKLNMDRGVVINIDGQGRVTDGTLPNTSYTYRMGDTVTLTAIPDNGYDFDGWYNGDRLVCAEPAYTFVVNDNMSLTAKFCIGNGMKGLGTPTSPYLIKTPEHFAEIANDMTAYYKIDANIDFGGGYWQPISGTFNGTIDGNGKALSNINIVKRNISDNGFYNLGLFETIGSNAYIHDLIISNSSLMTDQVSGKYPLIYGGLLCGINRGRIEKCNFINTNVTCRVDLSLAGTLCGYSTGIISNCNFLGIEVIGYDLVGGISGTLDTNSKATNCMVTSNLANNKRSLIQLTANTYAGASYVAGGICAYGFSNEIVNCFVSNTDFKLYGSTTRKPSMGYLVGHLNYGSINCSTSSYNSITRNAFLASNTKYKQDTNYSTYFFANNSGLVGKKEGSTTVKY